MGFFDFLDFTTNAVKDIHKDMKEFNKKTDMEHVLDIADRFRSENRPKDELLRQLYEAKFTEAWERYASCIILMEDYYFYDPYYMKKLRSEFWKLRKDDEYNLKNIDERLILQFEKSFAEYTKEELEAIVDSYISATIMEYQFKDSVYYYTIEGNKETLSNHYACFAAINILNEKYDTQVIFDDLSDSNDDDLREKRYKERVEKITNVALKTVIAVGNKYFPEEGESEINE